MTDFMATKDTVNTQKFKNYLALAFSQHTSALTAFYPLMQARVTSIFRMDKTKYKRKRSSVERIFKIDFYIINT
jgi:hypothetical protein